MDLQALTDQPISREELKNRRLVEFDMVMVGQIHRTMVSVADVVNTCGENENFKDLPDREKLRNEALNLYSRMARKQLRLARKIDKGLAKFEALAGKEDPLFGAETGKASKV